METESNLTSGVLSLTRIEKKLFQFLLKFSTFDISVHKGKMTTKSQRKTYSSFKLQTNIISIQSTSV